jgi:hypothetical protein
MVHYSKKQIIQSEQKFTFEEILSTQMNNLYIDTMFEDRYGANIFLAKLGIIKNEMKCYKCGGDPLMSYIKRTKAPYGCQWACKRPCTLTRPIREKSFFSNTRISTKPIFKVIYKYINGLSFGDVAYDLSLSRNTLYEITD